jgi:hypothetical protein
MSPATKYSISAGIAAIVVAGLGYFAYPKWIVIPKARQPILAFLKDPSSAEFRNERLGSSGAVCGEVNAKNAMGGYVGFKKYISAGKDGSYVEGQEPLDGWSAADVVRRKDLEAKIFARFVDGKKEFPWLQAPVGPELEELASKHFFESRWSEVCERGEKVRL